MRHLSTTFLAIVLLFGALVSTGHTQQPPVLKVDTTTAATQADSTTAPAPTVAPAPAPADSIAKAQSADSLTTVPLAPAVTAPAAPAPPPMAAPAQAAPAQTTPAAAPAPAPTSAPATATVSTQAAPAKKKRPIYFGGTVGFTFFGDVTRFYVQPMVGYKLTPKLSVGGKVGYEHLKYDNIQGDNTSDNWGASVFGRLRVLPMLYGHAEYALWSYDTGNDRTSVPYLLLGGGYVKPLGRGMAFTVEALVDVLQDEDSPYSDWEPWVTVGVQVGF